MAASLSTHSMSSKSLTTASNAKDRLEYLLDASYSKIEELRQLLIRESELQMKDCLKEMDPIIARQRSLHENVLKRMTDSAIQLSSNMLPTFGKNPPIRALTLQPKSIKSHSSQLHLAHQSHLPHSQSFPTVGPSLSVRELPKFDSIRELSRKEMHNKFPETSLGNDNLLSVREDKTWYGSLDRNVVKKKKRGPIDKTRRHTKIVGSMAGLERTDELQPDEQYKIGLPTLTKLDFGTQMKPRPPRALPLHYVPSPPPLPPPKTIGNSFPGNSGLVTITKPLMPLHVQESLPVVKSSNVSREIGPAIRGAYTEFDNKEVTSPKTWFETNLDDSFLMSSNYAGEFSGQSASTSIHSGTLDVTDSISRVHIASPATDISEKSSKSSESSEARAFINETIKPFEMSDYYKYSTKYRKAQNPSQAGETSTDNMNRNMQATSSTIANEELDTNRNPNLPVPKLPPRDSAQHAKQKPKAGPFLYRGVLQNAEIDELDTDLGWVMDTPTFV